MIQFGYGINRPRTIDLDRNDMTVAKRLLERMPELESCIACGSCTASCTAGALVPFNFRKLHTLLRRGEYKGAWDEINKCMLCGKCRLACPRGINTRGVVMAIKRELGEY